MQNLPNADEAAEFSEVLKSFYKVAYEGQNEPLPAILKVFEDEKPLQTIRIKEGLKSNGHHNPHHNSVPNGLIIKVPEVNGSCDEFSLEINGFPHRDSLAFGGFPHRDSLDFRNNGDYKLMEHQFSNGVNPVVIISSEDFEKHKKDERDDSGFQNGISEGLCVCVYKSVLKAYQYSIYSHLSLRQTLWGQHNVSMLERCLS